MRGGGRVGRAEPEDDHWELRGGVEQVEEVVAQALKRPRYPQSSARIAQRS